MTGPMIGGQNAPSQGGWQQVQGGYPVPGQQQQMQQAAPPLPPGLQAMQQAQQNAAFNLPPQMGGQPFPNQPSPIQNDPRFMQQDPRFVQQPQPPAPQGADAGTRLAGPNVPLHYQGRTVGEVIQMLEGVRQQYFQQQNQQQSAPQSGQSSQQTTGQPPANAGQQQPDWDWKAPAASVAKIVSAENEKLFARIQPMLGPVAANTMVASAQAARQSAASEIGVQRYQQIEPAVMEFLKGADPQSLTNPETWKAAARYVVGDLNLRGVQIPNGQPQQNGHQPGAFVQNGQVIQNPLPNLNGFFTEQPNQGNQGPQGVQMTQQDINMASAMGIPPADYAAWKSGIAYSNQQAGYR